ncbi:MAG: cob(I)yrinic acid a,c-diamide adenosyltransferase [Pseudomonadota bacterium]
MTRISKVYTRTGDGGTTALSDGSRVGKNDPRLDCYGTVDELNTLVGRAREEARRDNALPAEARQALERWLVAVQNDLFNLGADLATPVDKHWPQQIVADDGDVVALERLIDHCQKDLAPLREFVLPGGSMLNAELHHARTVCRRAERLAVALAAQAQVNPAAIKVLNRLSDLLFVLARWVCTRSAVPEMLWDRQQGLRTLDETRSPG